MAQARTVKAEPADLAVPTSQRARGVLDLTGTKLTDRPGLLEEKLLKTRGVFAAEINVFSHRIIVEFDPATISLDKIKAMVKAHNGS